MTFQPMYGNCEFLVITFLRMNDPITFMELMNRVFHNYIDSFVIVFIDDILVYSKNEEEHTDYLRVVLLVLN